ncbi:hypothetical protein [Thalassotalea sp. PLHSN55]|uniref:hypothetical protein n=1 Tax=Thalassotalea sp. PLHSN55 TaxID=3435888 RepID=UPI003F87C11F
MQAVSNAISQERRHYTPDQSALWDKLSITQKFSATSLNQFGYELAYVRTTNNGKLAIMLCNNNVATVDDDGEIDTAANIVIRS